MSTPAQVFAALVSTYSHLAALGVAASERPHFMELPEAARILRCDPDLTRRSARIRYAAIELASTGARLERSGGSPLLPELKAALDVLGIPDSFIAELAASPAESLADLQRLAGQWIDAAPEESSLAYLQRECCPCIQRCDVGPVGPESVVEFQISVNRSAACLSPAVDPQCWPAVAGAFKEAFVFDVQQCGSSGRPKCQGGPCAPSIPRPSPVSSPPVPGTPWCGLLLERVEIKDCPRSYSAELENVLEIRTRPLSTADPDYVGFQMDYGLCQSRAYEICRSGCSAGCESGICLVERDCGMVSVGGVSKTQTTLSGTKRLRLKDVSIGGFVMTGIQKAVAYESIGAACLSPDRCPSQIAGCALPTGKKCTCTGEASCASDKPMQKKMEAAFCD